MNKSLAGPSIEEYLVAAEAALQACSMILKKIDKKKDRLVDDFVLAVFWLSFARFGFNVRL